MITEKRLEELGEIVNGGTPSTQVDEYWDGDIPWITPKDLSTLKNKWISYGERNITKEGIDNSNAKLIPANSIMISTRAPVGYVARNRIDAATNQGIKSFIPNHKLVDADYMYYFFIKNTKLLNMKAGGTTFRELSTNSLKSLKIRIPELNTQKEIGRIISSFDDKISINNNLIESLKAYSQLLFHKWFIDFNFPDEEGKPYKDNGGEMYEVNGKMIPVGWKKCKLGDLVIETMNGDWGNEKHEDGLLEVLCIRGADIPNWNNGQVKNTPNRYIKKSDECNKILRDGDIVIEVSGGSPTQSTGRTVLIRDSILNRIEKPVCCSNFSKIIRTKSIENSTYLYYLLNNLYKRGVFFHYEGKTTGIKNLLLSPLMNNFKIYKPTEEILSKFENEVGLLMDKIYMLGKENELLEETRDLLVKKLIK